MKVKYIFKVTADFSFYLSVLEYLILHSVFENSALKVLSTELEINALAIKKKKKPPKS